MRNTLHVRTVGRIAEAWVLMLECHGDEDDECFEKCFAACEIYKFNIYVCMIVVLQARWLGVWRTYNICNIFLCYSYNFFFSCWRNEGIHTENISFKAKHWSHWGTSLIVLSGFFCQKQWHQANIRLQLTLKPSMLKRLHGSFTKFSCDQWAPHGFRQ